MKARISQVVMLTLTALLVVPPLLEAAPRAKGKAGGGKAACLETSLTIEQGEDGYEAVFAAEWKCRKTELHADMDLQVGDQEPVEGRIEGASYAELRSVIELEDGQQALEICADLSGFAVDRKGNQQPVGSHQCLQVPVPEEISS